MRIAPCRTVKIEPTYRGRTNMSARHATPTTAPRNRLRGLLAALALATGLGALAGCDGSRHWDFDDDPEIHVHVTNYHNHDIWVEGYDKHDNYVDFGVIREGRSATLGMDDAFFGESLRARCTIDGDVLDVEFAFDGLTWDVF